MQALLDALMSGDGEAAQAAFSEERRRLSGRRDDEGQWALLALGKARSLFDQGSLAAAAVVIGKVIERETAAAAAAAAAAAVAEEAS